MTEMAELLAQQAAERIAEFHAIDVRGEHEFVGPLGHLVGAYLIPLPELARRTAEIPRDRPLLLICRSGVRSAKACAQLVELGLGPVLNLAGGMIAWRRANLPVERTLPVSRAALLESALSWLAQVTGQPIDAARVKLSGALGERGDAVGEPTRGDAARALDAIAELAGEPPDLDLSMTAFRAALEELSAGT
jgi:rhodanese-related sulfurtransferase